MRAEHVRSYYAATAHPQPPFPALAGDVDCDVCVIGAGIAGCSSALHLAERGFNVVLLEDKRVGWGASGRSGAQVLPGFSAGHDKIERMLGKQTARALWDITVEALALTRDLIRRYSIDCDWVDGHLLAAIKPRHRAELVEWAEQLEREYAYRSVRLIEGSELRDLLQTRRYIAGLYDTQSGHMHPLNYTLGLARAAALGAEPERARGPGPRGDPRRSGADLGGARAGDVEPVRGGGDRDGQHDRRSQPTRRQGPPPAAAAHRQETRLPPLLQGPRGLGPARLPLRDGR